MTDHLIHYACLQKYLAEEVKRLTWKENALREHGKLSDGQALHDREWATENRRLAENVQTGLQ